MARFSQAPTRSMGDASVFGGDHTQHLQNRGIALLDHFSGRADERHHPLLDCHVLDDLLVEHALGIGNEVADLAREVHRFADGAAPCRQGRSGEIMSFVSVLILRF